MRAVRFLLAPVLFATVSAAVPAVPELKIEPYTFEAASGETVEAELGRIEVPENRSREDSRTIVLKFVRFKSTAEKAGSPIVYLAGGPGGSGIGAARGSRFPLFMALREFGDVIALDQRGTGMSGFEDLDCDDRYLIPFHEPVDPAKAARIMSNVTKGCIERLRKSGIDVSAYNTIESAADLNDLRQALGAEKLTLWGISYGTHLSLAMMKYHGKHVDRAILAGVEGLHHSYKLPGDQQELMEQIARLAKKDPAIRKAVPDLLGSIRKLMAQLEKEPQTVELTHPTNGMTMRVTVGKFDLQRALAGMLRGPDSFRPMADAIARLEAGDWVALAMSSAQGRQGEGFHAMSVAMDCASGASRDWLDRIAREAGTTLLGDAINFPFPMLCEGLGVGDLGDEFRSPVESDVPTLLISGTLDGRTPVNNGTEVEQHLANSQHLIIEGAGHSDPLFLSSPKILEDMHAFMRGEKIPVKRIELPPVELIVPRKIVALDDDTLSAYVGTYEIRENDTRVVIKAGNLLFTRRGRGPALPIRPTSKTEFFYDGDTTHLKFDTDDEGRVLGMVVFHGGGTEGEPAKKIE